jgi:hypothetical protein
MLRKEHPMLCKEHPMLCKEDTMKASLVLGTLILTVAGLTAAALPLLSSAEEGTEAAAAPFLTAAVECPTFSGTLQLVADDNDPDVTHATVIDESGDVHATYGFGISGETMIIAPDVITRGIELGTPQDTDASAGTMECLIRDVQTSERTLTQEDIDVWSLDPSLTGAYAEIETSLTGLVWVAP